MNTAITQRAMGLPHVVPLETVDGSVMWILVNAVKPEEMQLKFLEVLGRQQGEVRKSPKPWKLHFRFRGGGDPRFY